MTARIPLLAAAISAIALSAPAAASAQAPAPTGGATFGDEATGLVVEPGAMLGDPLVIRGNLPSLRGTAVRVERRADGDDEWTPVGRDVVGADGTLEVTWETDAPGRHDLRVVPDTGTAQASAAASAAEDETASATTTVHRRTRATWYGPGFWGRRTACGIRLTKRTIGVAHKTLPCGTRVSVLLDGRQIELPVIDRGPFAKGMTLDLTQAAARAIGMLHTTDVGWVRLSKPGARR